MKKNTQYIAAARRMYESDGEIEIDDDAKISRGAPDGAYVQAWVFVYTTDINEMEQA
jgi:hypothetical protein